MTEKLTTADKIRHLPWYFVAHGANGVFIALTVFGALFVLFLNELGLDKTRIGILISLLPFSGILAPFIGGVAERIGLKRLCLFGFGVRAIVLLFLLGTPWVLDRYGEQIAFGWVTGIVLAFAIIRIVGLTGITPWTQEIIPDHIRGKVAAGNLIAMSLAQVLAVAGGSYVVGRYAGLTPFMALIGVGVIAGLFCTLCFSFLPGGRPQRGAKVSLVNVKSMLEPLRDRNFRRYMAGIGLIMPVWTALMAFVPLYVKDQIGLDTDRVILLEAAMITGGLLSSYLWGWAADRYGSKPIILTGVAMLCVVPLGWFLMPRNSNWSMPLAMGLAGLAGWAWMGRTIGGNRYLFVTAVPAEKKTAYMAIWIAWIGFVGGCGSLLAGRFIDYCSGIDATFLIFTIDAYTPLFGVGFAMLLIGWLLTGRVRSDGAISTRQFVGLFLQGNPFMALESLMRYHWAGQETDRVHITERLGHAKNPLSMNELIDALHDPSFNVRFEAVVAAAHLRGNSQLTNELIDVLVSGDPELSVAAAWALGKLGDGAAIVPLREMTRSKFVPLQTGSTRALARLGDVDSIAAFRDELQKQSDPRRTIAYAAALGQLHAAEAIPAMLGFLGDLEDKMLRSEAALALARILGHEHAYIRLWRGINADLATAAARTLSSGRKRIVRHYPNAVRLGELIGICADRFARNDLKGAAEGLTDVLRCLDQTTIAESPGLILAECAERLAQYGAERIEYVTLALHALTVAELPYRP